MANEISKTVPPIADFESRFSFIDDDVLRKNICISFQYVVFLIAVLDKEKAEGTTIANSIHKDIVTHTVCVVEACTHHTLKKAIDAGIFLSSDIMPNEEKQSNKKEIYKISETEAVFVLTETKKAEKLSHNTKLIALNKAAKKADIFDKDTFDMAEELRILRNKIHLTGLGENDHEYSKTLTDKVFKDAKLIIDALELFLSKPTLV